MVVVKMEVRSTIKDKQKAFLNIKQQDCGWPQINISASIPRWVYFPHIRVHPSVFDITSSRFQFTRWGDNTFHCHFIGALICVHKCLKCWSPIKWNKGFLFKSNWTFWNALRADQATVVHFSFILCTFITKKRMVLKLMSFVKYKVNKVGQSALFYNNEKNHS